MTIRIRKIHNSDWLSVSLLVAIPGWMQVDDGETPIDDVGRRVSRRSLETAIGGVR